MPRYEVRLTRDASESIDVIVEAASADEANDTALSMAGVYGEELPDNWTLDDGCMNKVYLPDEDSTEEVDDDRPLTVAGDAIGDVTIGEDFDEFLNEATHALRHLWLKYSGNILTTDETYALNDAVTAFFDGKRNALI